MPLPLKAGFGKLGNRAAHYISLSVWKKARHTGESLATAISAIRRKIAMTDD